MTSPTKAVALAYDGVAYSLPTRPGRDSRAHLNTLLRAFDPFQNAENEWRRALTFTSTRY